MAPPPSLPSKASDISPLRSLVFLELVTTTLLATGISTLCASEFIPKFLEIALQFTLNMAYVSSIIGLILLIMVDQSKNRAAMTAHLLISAAIGFVLCFSKWIERGGFKGFTQEDFSLCSKLVIWTITCGMLSAIWIRGGAEALKREAKAVPGNLWLFLYE